MITKIFLRLYFCLESGQNVNGLILVIKEKVVFFKDNCKKV